MKGYSPSVLRMYAKTLLEISGDKEVVEYLDILKYLGTLCGAESFRESLFNPVISGKMKTAIILEVLKVNGFEDDKFNRFVEVVIENRREKIFETLWQSFEALAYNKAKISKALMVSAYKVNEDTVNAVKKVLEKLLFHPVEMETKLDPSLLAGAKVFVEDRILDLSAKGQLDKMSRLLISEER